MGAGGTGLFWLWPLLVVIGLVLLGYVGYRLVQSGPARRSSDGGEARRVLDVRFARGEIDEQEYLRSRSGSR
jgi:putative membrane protein